MEAQIRDDEVRIFVIHNTLALTCGYDCLAYKKRKCVIMDQSVDVRAACRFGYSSQQVAEILAKRQVSREKCE